MAEELGKARARVLCLHGYGTNSIVMQFQLNLMKRHCPGIECVFVNSNFECEAAPGITMFFPKGPYYKWFPRQPEHSDIAKMISRLEACFEHDGPFDGIIGFSQGGLAASFLVATSEQGKVQLQPPKFMISMCGPEPRPETIAAFPVFDDQIMTPSLHVVAEKDTTVLTAKAASKHFLNPKIVTHSGDHRPLPVNPKEALGVLRHIERFIVETMNQK